jgi:hypothetical protein
MFNNVSGDVGQEPEVQPMQVGKAKGWLGTYSWVTIPITEQNKYDDTTVPAIEWCQQYFGKSGARWFEKQKKFYFKDEKDMTMFILRFCS